jgi:hypothetical protein
MWLALPNAMKSKLFTCATVDRAHWEHRAEFVGHTKPVIVAVRCPCGGSLPC